MSFLSFEELAEMTTKEIAKSENILKLDPMYKDEVAVIMSKYLRKVNEENTALIELNTHNFPDLYENSRLKSEREIKEFENEKKPSTSIMKEDQKKIKKKPTKEENRENMVNTPFETVN